MYTLDSPLYTLDSPMYTLDSPLYITSGPDAAKRSQTICVINIFRCKRRVSSFIC